MKYISTLDGSPTLYVPELDEHYHSVNGAYTEAMHVYIEAALRHHPKEEVAVLEIGFGTGLNALLTLNESLRSSRTIAYTSLEKYPLSDEIVATLNYTAPEMDAANDWFHRLHATPWNEWTPLTPHFQLKKQQCDFRTFTPTEQYDVVYFDAFAPDKQPDMWYPDYFATLYQAMNPGGIITTYCAKGAVRRSLQQAGFRVERIPGPPGKREMLRGERAE